MQFLFEDWHQFLDEKVEKTRAPDGAARERTALAHNTEKALYSYLLYWREYFRTTDENELYDILYDAFKEIPALRENKIVGILGRGTQGIVYELDNMHALKLFFEGYMGDRTGKSELEFYKHAYEDLHKGTAKIHTLPVFGFGKVESPGRVKGPLYYVEMAIVKTLKQYSEETARDKRSLDHLARMILDFLKESDAAADARAQAYVGFPPRRQPHRTGRAAPDPEYFKNRILTTAQAMVPPPTKNELIGLIRMVKSLYDEFGKEIFRDMSPDNIGVLGTSVPRGAVSHKGIKLIDPNAKPIFILFDP